MGYCKQCGAYLPDGQSKCLACGFDEDAKSASAAAAQSRPKPRVDSDAMRKQMEEQRARQREQSRLWAEQEAQRRKQEREQQQEREQEQTERPHIPYAKQDDDDASKASPVFDASSSRFMSILSYISALCFIPLLVCKDDDFAMFHAKQGLRLFIFTSLGNVLGGFLGFGWIFTVAQMFFIFKGISNAANGKKEPLPYIGTLLKF